MRNFEISIKAYQKGLAQVLLKDLPSEELPHIRLYRLDLLNLGKFCSFEIKSFAEGILLSALSKYFQFYEKNKQFAKKTLFQNQTFLLKILHQVLLSAELSVLTGFYEQAVTSILYLFNLLKSFL